MPARSRIVSLLAVVVLLSGCAGAEAPSLREGRSVYGDRCSVCHGPRGEGKVGPSLADVTATWPSCADQQRWIELGSDGWRAEFGQTYGATNRPIAGGMPAHSGTLTPAQIAAVAAFERIEYGGAEAEPTFRQCGVSPSE